MRSAGNREPAKIQVIENLQSGKNIDRFKFALVGDHWSGSPNDLKVTSQEGDGVGGT